MTEEKFHRLLERTAKFYEAIQAHVEGLAPYPEKRFIVAFQSGMLSLEHAISALVLTEQGLFSSAVALSRPQFESLVRGIWLLYAANENWVEKLSEPLTIESAKRANEGLGLADMLKELEKNTEAPAHIVNQLRECKETCWKAMNSYAHGGLHPLSRTLTGFPIQLCYDVLRNSNGVVSLTFQLLSILTGQPENMKLVREMHVEFKDVLHLLTQPVD